MAASGVSSRVLIYGGKGALGATCVSYFKARDWIQKRVDEILDGKTLDTIVCVAGGWAGGSAKSKAVVKNADLMFKQSVWTSLISSSIAAKHLKSGGLLSLTGAQPSLGGTPGMMGYGMAKAAVHQLVRGLAMDGSGLPPDTVALAILPMTLDTPMNRKNMSNADFSQWTTLEYVADWAQGYDGGSASFVNINTLCFICGNNVKFINIKDNSVAFLPSPGDGIGRLATNPTHELYGFSEMKPSPQIFVYQFPNFTKPQAILKDGAKLSYSSLAFANNGSILASISGLPDFKLTICVFKLPPASGTPEDGEFENLSHSISRMGRAFTTEEFRLTKAAIGGIVGKDSRDYEPGEDNEESVSSNVFTFGCTNCLSLHKNGLYAGGQGSMQLYQPEGNLTKLFDVNNVELVGVDCLLGGTEYSVVTCMACCPSSSTTAVGTANGYVYFVELTNIEKPRLIACVHVHQGPVLQICYDLLGQIYLTGSNDGHVFVCDARVTNNFKVLGHTDIQGTIASISCLNERENDGHGPWKVVAAYSANDSLHADKMVEFEVTKDILYRSPRDAFVNKALLYRKDAIKLSSHKLVRPIYSVMIASPQTAYAVGHNRKELIKLLLTQESQGPNNEMPLLESSGSYVGHDLHGVSLTQRKVDRFLLTCNTTNTTSNLTHKTDHHYHHHYTTGTITTADIITTKYHCHSLDYDHHYHHHYTTGTITTTDIITTKYHCHSLDYDHHYHHHYTTGTITTTDIITTKYHCHSLDYDHHYHHHYTTGTITTTDIITTKYHCHSLDYDHHYHHHYTTGTITTTDIITTKYHCHSLDYDHHYHHHYTTGTITTTDIITTKYHCHSLDYDHHYHHHYTTTTGTITTADIITTKYHCHSLDYDHHYHHHYTWIAQSRFLLTIIIRDEIEMSNLARIYLKEMIKRECWDAMVVKGRSCNAFRLALSVTNYPMRDRTKDELDELQFVLTQRKIEKAESEASKDLTPGPASTRNTPVPDDKFDFEDEDFYGEEDNEPSGTNPATTGSRGASYGGANDLLQSQFQLHTAQQKYNQIVLLKDAIHRIKLNFNKEFDETFKFKESEVKKIQEKNERIKKILSDLDMTEK
ncbi:hypothetical protein QZH41_003634 [Actinostola sp. cb2023]|nr:hypothetical protein QZH41_003634 [Actinostola sp. cb2023]